MYDGVGYCTYLLMLLLFYDCLLKKIVGILPWLAGRLRVASRLWLLGLVCCLAHRVLLCVGGYCGVLVFVLVGLGLLVWGWCFGSCVLGLSLFGGRLLSWGSWQGGSMGPGRHWSAGLLGLYLLYS